jgi:ADP-heptose:LPS heptosyltransferase
VELQPKHFRQRRNFAIARVAELFRPVLSSAARRVTGAAIEPRTWRRGLLLGADHIGDALYNTASLPHLRAGLPDCAWSFVTSSPTDQVLRNNPALAEVIVKTGAADTLRRIASGNFDVAVCYNSGGYWQDLLFACRAGIPNRVGYVHKGFSGLVTQPISIVSHQPYPAYFRDLVSQLTGEPASWDLRPQVFPDATDTNEAEKLWRELGLGGDRRVLACFVTSRQPTRVWPLEFFGETLARLITERNVNVVLCGGAGDEPLLNDLRDRFQLRCAVNAGRLSLRALVPFLAKCSAVLSTDSGPRHLANAAGVPVFFFRNLRSSAVETGTYLDTETDLSPASLEFVAPADQERYLRAIVPAEVAEKIGRPIAAHDNAINS